MSIREDICVKQEIGIVLVNTGSPSAPDPDSVKEYLQEFLMNARIRPMAKIPWSGILNTFILPKRKVTSAKKYERIWTEQGSPLVATQERLALKLEESLANEGLSVRVLSAMSFGRPTLDETFAHLEIDDCSKAIVLPMYPQGAFSTTKIVEDAVAEIAKRSELARDAVFVHEYFDSPAYIDAIADSICKAGFTGKSGERVMLSFHSVPIADIEAGDTYDVKVQATVDDLAVKLNASDIALGFQSRFDKERTWLSPFTGPVLDSLAEDGSCKKLYFACPGFASDCLETLYEIELEMASQFRKVKGDDDSFVYVKCLNDTDEHVEVLKKVLMPYL